MICRYGTDSMHGRGDGIEARMETEEPYVLTLSSLVLLDKLWKKSKVFMVSRRKNMMCFNYVHIIL